MKVGITCYPTFGGSGVVATELGHELARRGHDVHFIAYALPARLDVFAPRVAYHEVSIPTYPLFPYAPYDLALATRMTDVAVHEHLDVMHVHYAIPHAISAHLAREMLAPFPLRIVTTLHGTDVTIVGQDMSYLPITRFGIEKSDAVTAVSENLRQTTIDVFRPEKEIDVIPNFVDPARWLPAQSKELASCFGHEDARVILHVSNFRPVKRVLDVVEVFDRINKVIPSLLLMIGDGPDRPAAEQLCRDKGLSPRAHFLGNSPAIDRIMPQADLYVLPTNYESFGLSALEAQACGVPVLGYTAGGLPEVVEDGVTGFLRAVGDVDGLAACGLAILEDRAAFTLMADRARERAIRLFSADSIVEKYLSIYERVISAS